MKYGFRVLGTSLLFVLGKLGIYKSKIFRRSPDLKLPLNKKPDCAG